MFRPHVTFLTAALTTIGSLNAPVASAYAQPPIEDSRVVAKYLESLKTPSTDATEERRAFMALGGDGLEFLLEHAGTNPESLDLCLRVFCQDGGAVFGRPLTISDAGLAAILNRLQSSNEPTRRLCISLISEQEISEPNLDIAIDKLRYVWIGDSSVSIRKAAENQLTGIAFGQGAHVLSPANVGGPQSDLSRLVRIGAPALPALTKVKNAAESILKGIAEDPQMRQQRDISRALGGGDDTMAEKWLRQLAVDAAQAIATIERTPKPKDPALAKDIFLACEKGDHEDVVAACGSASSLSVRNRDGFTPLCLAAHYGNIVAIAELINRGANVSESTADGRSALHIAAERGDAETCLLLLRCGADARVRTSAGMLPVDLLRRHFPTSRVTSADDLEELAIESVNKLVEQRTREVETLSKKAVDLCAFRERLIRDHRADQRRLLALHNLYATVVTRREDDLHNGYIRETITTHRIDGGRIPNEYTKDLELPLPDEIGQSYAVGARTIQLARLAFGDRHERYLATKKRIESLLNELRRRVEMAE